MPLHDISYQHWTGAHLGVWHRRWAIARNGLTASLRIKWMRNLLMLGWGGALGMIMLMFLIGQLLVADSIVVRWIGGFSSELQLFARMLTSWLEQHPEISVNTTQNLLFYWFSTRLLKIGIIALGMIMPVLITRDLASSAIIIYSSKAVSRGDYLLGKFSTAFGLLTMAWFAPLCVAWLMGNLLAPDWKFFWHSRHALFHTAAFGLISMAVLSLLALGVSAISTKEKSTIALWYIWWVFGGVLAPIATNTQPWLRHLSFGYNLDQIALAIFRLGKDLTVAQDNIPVFGEVFRHWLPPRIMSAINEPTVSGAVFSLVFLVGIAALIVHKRVKPE
jgi:ABC-2 type transport system permease protein